MTLASAARRTKTQGPSRWRTARRPGMLTRVEELRLQLVLRPVQDTIVGEVRTADGRVSPFEGWLGLIAAIERAGGEQRGSPAPRDLTDP